MTDDEIREQLAEALPHYFGCAWALNAEPCNCLPVRRVHAERLVPTVRAIAAAEFRTAANGIGDWPGIGNSIRSMLRDRADELEAR